MHMLMIQVTVADLWAIQLISFAFVTSRRVP